MKKYLLVVFFVGCVSAAHGVKEINTIEMMMSGIDMAKAPEGLYKSIIEIWSSNKTQHEKETWTEGWNNATEFWSVRCDVKRADSKKVKTKEGSKLKINRKGHR